MVGVLSSLMGMMTATARASDQTPFQAAPARMPAIHPSTSRPTPARRTATFEFIARGRQCDVLIAPTEAVLVLGRRTPPPSGPPSEQLAPRSGRILQSLSVRFRLENANPQAAASGLDELPARANYFFGNDPARWRTGVPLSRVRIARVYPGISLAYYADESARLEYDSSSIQTRDLTASPSPR